jgi:hypothetical protein
MTTVTEVRAADWAAFFDRLMGELPTTWATIEIEAPELGHQVEARDLLLEHLGYDARNDVLEVAAFHPGPKGRAVLRHHIEHPVAVHTDAPRGILPTAVEIRSRDGVRTLVRLHGAPALSS